MSGLRLSDEQRVDWLRLIRSERVGPRTFRTLVNRFGGAAAALDALPDLARKSGRGALRITSRTEAAREVEGLAKLGARLVAQGEPDYPKPLLATDDAPPLIAVRGAPACLGRPTVAIVGSRNASAAGGAFAARLAAELGRAGYVVVSGLARGIDARAHQAALASGTVAVLAGGHDRIYPDAHRPLLERIVGEGGAAVSEMPLGWEARGRDFPRRNRIVSGLCLGTVVVEAARRSGSLITARFALEQGREVFAVPGSPLDPRAEGVNDLIRGGATLCADPDHVLAVLEPLRERAGDAPPRRDGLEETREAVMGQSDGLWDELDLDGAPAPVAALRSGPGDDLDDDPEDARPMDDTTRILQLLGATPVSVDDLCRQAELPVRRVKLVLVELELAHRLERHGGNAVSLMP